MTMNDETHYKCNVDLTDTIEIRDAIMVYCSDHEMYIDGATGKGVL